MKQKYKQWAALAGLAAAAAGGATTHAQTSDPALNALVQKGILTEKEAKEALAAAEAEAKSRAAGDIRFFWKDGLGFQSANGMFRGKLGGRLHLDIASFSEDEQLEAAIEDRKSVV